MSTTTPNDEPSELDDESQFSSEAAVPVELARAVEGPRAAAPGAEADVAGGLKKLATEWANLYFDCGAFDIKADPAGYQVVMDKANAAEKLFEESLRTALLAGAANFDVRTIMLDVVPGDDGMGHEVYATSVKDVEAKLSSLWQRLEDYELGVTTARPPVPVRAPQGVTDDEVADAIKAYEAYDPGEQPMAMHAALTTFLQGRRLVTGALPASPECENCNQLASALREATESPTFMGEPVSQLSRASNWVWTHIKSGGEYSLLGDARLQSDKPLLDMAMLYVYQGEDGLMWARPIAEFNERFKRTRPLAATPVSAVPAGPPQPGDVVAWFIHTHGVPGVALKKEDLGLLADRYAVPLRLPQPGEVQVDAARVEKLVDDFAFEAGKSAIAVLQDVDYRTPDGIIIKQGFNRARDNLIAAIASHQSGVSGGA